MFEVVHASVMYWVEVRYSQSLASGMDSYRDSWVPGDSHMQSRLHPTALGQDEEHRAVSCWSQSPQEQVVF